MSTWHIITSEYPPDVGGVSDYTRQVAEGLARDGDHVHVWCPRPAERSHAPTVRIHPELGRLGPRDLDRVDELLKSFPGPRRLLVQWVPHGFGFHSMNVWFCLWLAKRAWGGDFVELVVHEPYLEFAGPVRHRLMAIVHRAMTIVLLAASRRVWLSIPAWERRLRPYTLGRRLPMRWLPVPACIPPNAIAKTPSLRSSFASDEQPLVGHFGSYGSAVSTLLRERLPAIMDSRHAPALLLIGRGSDELSRMLLEEHPSWTGRVHAAGFVPSADLSEHLAVCDVCIQPYPDGISSRRTSAMACLSQARPVVTTRGHLTEPLWSTADAAVLVDVADVRGFASNVTRLLGDPVAARKVGVLGRRLYNERFTIEGVVAALRAA